MRLIDADALKTKAETIQTIDCWHMRTEEQAVLVEHIDNAPTIDAVPCWIPCGERLPKEYNEYLCCDKDGEYYVNYLEDAYWAREFTESESIVAWMPLPEPYDGERKDNEDS